jgi:hypothetical protein
MAAPTIDSTNPSSGAVGVPVNTTVSIIFDQEVDIARLKDGGVILEGPDESKSIGPGFEYIEPPETDEDEFLSSPTLKGITPVSYTIQRVDGSGNVVPYYDYGSGVDAGSVYRTKLVLTPKTALGALTEYTVYIIGDEDQDDDYDYGVSARTVYDTIKDAVIGSGEVLFYGGYTGALRDRFHLELTSTGTVGTATYKWWRDSDLTERTGTTSAGKRLLADGVKVQFYSGQTYQDGDTFSVWCDVPVFMESSYQFSFTTSDHTIETLPTPSTVLTGSTSTSSSTSSTSLSVSSTSPEDRQALVPITLTSITVTLSDSIDASTVSTSTVSVVAKAVDDSLDQSVPYTETLTYSVSVSGTVITITLDADQLYENNLVVVTLDSSIADTDGNTLGSDTAFFFGTSLNPFYAGIRHVRLRLGAIGDRFPDETIAFAIWDASREALALAPASIGDSSAYIRARTMFVVCLASWYLVGGGRSSTGGGRKRLADLDVSIDDSVSTAIMDDLKDCFDRYELALRSGGEAGFGASLKPLAVVKGTNDLDEPAFGRTWERVSEAPISNARHSQSSWRRWYHTYKRRP